MNTTRARKLFLRLALTAALTAVFVLHGGVFPEGLAPAGSPAVVEARVNLSSMKVYKYDRLVNAKDVAPAAGSYDRLFVYQYQDHYYAPYTRLLGENNWPVKDVEALFPHFDPSWSTFYSRTKVLHSVLGKNGSDEWGPNGIYIHPKYNGIGETGENGLYTTTGWSKIDFKNENGSNMSMRLEVSEIDNTDKFHIFYRYLHNGNRTNGTNLSGDNTKIYGSLFNRCEFMVYSVSTLNYTCINSNCSIDDNQVFTADSDLFITENGVLNIPDGSVLSVSKGPLFLNGKIVCRGTILVEGDGIIETWESAANGGHIVIEEGGALIIRNGGKVFTGCPQGIQGTLKNEGYLEVKSGGTVINFGRLVAGQVIFRTGSTLENHSGGQIDIGYSVDDQNGFESCKPDSSGQYLPDATTSSKGRVTYEDNCVFRIYAGSINHWSSNNTDRDTSKKPVKYYYYDSDGNCTVEMKRLSY